MNGRYREKMNKTVLENFQNKQRDNLPETKHSLYKQLAGHNLTPMKTTAAQSKDGIFEKSGKLGNHFDILIYFSSFTF